jgi:hypothetical protein
VAHISAILSYRKTLDVAVGGTLSLSVNQLPDLSSPTHDVSPFLPPSSMARSPGGRRHSHRRRAPWPPLPHTGTWRGDAPALPTKIRRRRTRSGALPQVRRRAPSPSRSSTSRGGSSRTPYCHSRRPLPCLAPAGFLLPTAYRNSASRGGRSRTTTTTQGHSGR